MKCVTQFCTSPLFSCSRVESCTCVKLFVVFCTYLYISYIFPVRDIVPVFVSPDIHAEEVVLESSHEPVVVLPLQTETAPLQPIINRSVATTADGSLPVIDSLSISDSGFTSKPASVEAVGTVRHQSLVVTFPINRPCFSFSVGEPSTSGQSTDDQNKLHLENKPFRLSLEPSNISCHDLQNIGYLCNSDHEKKLVVFTGNVISGGLIALWGFNVNVTNVLEANGLSAEEVNRVTEDRFQRDVFLQQVLELLLKS